MSSAGRERVVAPRGAGIAADAAALRLRINELVRAHLRGDKKWLCRTTVLEALTKADPVGKVWSRQRLDYQIERIRMEELKTAREAESSKRPSTRSPYSPSDA